MNHTEPSYYVRSRDKFNCNQSRDHIRSQSRDSAFDESRGSAKIKCERQDDDYIDPSPRSELVFICSYLNLFRVKLERSRQRSRSRSPGREHGRYRDDSRDRRRCRPSMNPNRNNRTHHKNKNHFTPRDPPKPKSNWYVVSSASSSYASQENGNRVKTSDLKGIQSKFEVLSKRHATELELKPRWEAPAVVRRSRAMVLSGYQNDAEINLESIEDETEDDDLVIDEGFGSPAADTETKQETQINATELTSVMESADSSETIGSQALKELRKDFEKGKWLCTV